MPGYQDSQPDGPEPQPWQQPQFGHGFYEPSKDELLRKAPGEYSAERQHFHRLMADNYSSNKVWWERLMQWLKEHA